MNERLKLQENTNPGYIEKYFYPEITSGHWNFKEGMRAYDVWDLSGSYQSASDLLTIDGPGLNHPPGKEVKHIDEMFL